MWIAVFGCWLLQQLLLVLSLPKNYSNYSIITLHSDSMGNSFDLVTFQTHIKLQMSQCVIGKRRQKYAKLFFAKPVKSKLSSYSNNNNKTHQFSIQIPSDVKLELKIFINERNVLAKCFENKTNSTIQLTVLQQLFPRRKLYFSSNIRPLYKLFRLLFHTLCNFIIHKNKSDTSKLRKFGR